MEVERVRQLQLRLNNYNAIAIEKAGISTARYSCFFNNLIFTFITKNGKICINLKTDLKIKV